MTIEDARIAADYARQAATFGAQAEERAALAQAVIASIEGKPDADIYRLLFEACAHHDAYLSAVRSAPRKRRTARA